MYGGYGYGGIPPTGYGMGAPMGGPGYPGGFQMQGRYMFTAQMIDMNAATAFMKYDFTRNGVLNYPELRMAINEFTMLCGQMPVMDADLMALFQIFDLDGSGQIDFFEYRMMLEHLAGIRYYDRNMLMGIRGQRGYHLQQYRGFW